MNRFESEFELNGFSLLSAFFTGEEIGSMKGAVLTSNESWLAENRQLYERGAVNSAYLTSARYCQDRKNRESLFRFIASEKLVSLARRVIGSDAYFRNTQLFFNPEKADRKPYWHRDIQYSGLPEDEQKERIRQDAWLHFRIPLGDDPGLEFIPGSHRRWDNEEELDVRLERNGRKNSEDLPASVRVPHKETDLLIFSAHLIHKGVYGGERKSFDILLGNQKNTASDVETNKHFPEPGMLGSMQNPGIYSVQE